MAGGTPANPATLVLPDKYEREPGGGLMRWLHQSPLTILP